MAASLRILSSKADSNTWESFTRSELKLESAHQESPRSDIFRKRATKPLLKQKHCQKHLTWAKETNNWNVPQWSKVRFRWKYILHLIWKPMSQSLEEEWRGTCWLKSSVKFTQSVMIWAAMSSAGVGPLCFLKSTVNAAIYKDILEHFMLPSADKLYGDDFILPEGLGTCPHCQRYQKLVQWPWCYCAWLPSKLAWPEPDRASMMRDTRPNNVDDQNPIENLWERHQTQQCRWPEPHRESMRETPDPTMQMTWSP